jgi:hypothetical protein
LNDQVNRAAMFDGERHRRVLRGASGALRGAYCIGEGERVCGERSAGASLVAPVAELLQIGPGFRD